MNSTYRMVVGADGSEGSRYALHWALREAAHRRATVQVVAAWRQAPVEPAASADSHSIGDEAAAVAVLREEADRAAGVVDPMPAVAWEAVEGRPPRALTQAARGARLLVLGSHGHGRMFHAVLGSVSEECVRYSPCPVVVVPTPRPDREFLPEEPAVF
jgi:nucleotide-binding universal stress UspA family protein